jgi:hypothetical protein
MMRNLTIAAVLLVSVLFTSCNSTEKELVGSWKRTEFLNPGDEPTTDYREGFILDLNEDLSFNLRYTKTGGGRERKKKGTWAIASPTMKDDLAALVLRFDDGNSVTEETHRLRSLSEDEMRLIFVDHTSVFRRR